MLECLLAKYCSLPVLRHYSVLQTNDNTKLTTAIPVCSCSVWVVQLVEEAVDYVGPVCSGVQTELTSWTQSILIHLPCENKRVFHQCYHTQSVSLDGESWPPASSDVAVPLAIPSPHPSPETLSLAAPEPSHQPQDPSL